MTGSEAAAAAPAATTPVSATTPSSSQAGLPAGIAPEEKRQAVPGDPPLAPPDKQPPNLSLPKPVGKKVGFAIMGLGKLAVEEVLPAFGLCRYARPTALVSGHPEKAKQLAKVYGIDPKHIYNYDDYDKIRDDADVDVIYNILPNSMHAEFTIRGLEAGKHVLCEKPLAINVAECDAMIAAGKKAGKILMTAYRLHYQPHHQKLMQICRDEELGKVRTFSATFSQQVEAPNIRLSRTLGGDSVGDVGVYCINAARYSVGETPVSVTATAYQPDDDPRFREVPASVAFTMTFPSGAVAACECSFNSARSDRLRVGCTDGTLDMDPAFAYYGQRLTMSKDDQQTVFDLKPVDHFASQMDHLAECVLEDKMPRTPGEEGRIDLQIIAAIDEAIRSGKSVDVG